MHAKNDPPRGPLASEAPTVAGPPAARPAGNDHHPECVGPYVVLSLLGRGGMGAVYLARRQDDPRAVALKVAREGHDADGFPRLAREARALASLDHPAFVRPFDLGEVGPAGARLRYLAMEHVEGRPLTEFASPLELGARLELAARVCEAVQHAHERGIVHRDLKPSNILVTPEGDPRVLDLGVAVAPRAPDDEPLTRVGDLVGTVPYMSPEQIGADARSVDFRSDIYTLGVLLYELLTGRLPHDLRHASLARAARAIEDEEPAMPSSVNRALRGGVDAIIARALAKDPCARYASAGELAADIRRCARGDAVHAPPPTRARAGRATAPRGRWMWAACVLVLGAALAVQSVRAAEAQRRAAEAERRAGDAAADAGDRSTPTGEGRSASGRPLARRER